MKPLLNGSILLIAASLAATPAAALAARGGTLTIKAIDADTGQLVPVRMHLKDQRGKPVEPPNVPFWKDHFVFAGQITLKLKPGQYTFELERGPEYKDYKGHFLMKDDAEDEKTIEMHRFVDLSKEGWWSGELHVHRPVEQVELLMRAEDLHVAPVITWWKGKARLNLPTGPSRGLVEFDENRFYHDLAGEDERNGGALLYFNLPRPLDLGPADAEYPAAEKFLRQAKEFDVVGKEDAEEQEDAAADRVHVDIEKPFWWDVPAWLATGQADSIGLANNHLWRDGVYEGEAWGKPRDKILFPSPQGNGRWSEAIYYHVLNCGLRIPPSAGSASGVLPNPVGYNRVYVYCGENFSYQRWFEGLRAGRVFITNGSLLRTRVESQPPGYVFKAEQGDKHDFEIGLKLSMREPVEYLEIIKNGESLHQIRLEDYAKSQGKLPKVPFDDSGWFLVRAVTNNDKTYRYASTGPYYVEFAGRPRVSRKSAEFFVAWVDERIKQLEKVENEQHRAELVALQNSARAFWQNLVDNATAK